MEKMIAWLVILLISLISVSAGCFFYPDSPAYCTSLSDDRAERECALYEDCDLSAVYDPASCPKIPACEKVLCKSSCQEEYQGKCTAGIIPKIEQSQWCSAGCCSVGSSCEYVENQWQCEVLAANTNEQYDFKVGDEQDCQTLCARKGILKTPLLEIPPALETITMGKNVSEEAPEKNSWWWILLALFLLGILAYYLTRRYPPHPQKPTVKAKAPLPKEVVPTATVSARLIQLQQRFQHLIKDKRRQQALVESGLPASPTAESSFPFLQRLVKRQNKKTPHNAVQMLEKKLSKLTRPEQEKVLQDVKKIVGRK